MLYYGIFEQLQIRTEKHLLFMDCLDEISVRNKILSMVSLLREKQIFQHLSGFFNVQILNTFVHIQISHVKCFAHNLSSVLNFSNRKVMKVSKSSTYVFETSIKYQTLLVRLLMYAPSTIIFQFITVVLQIYHAEDWCIRLFMLLFHRLKLLFIVIAD